MTALNAGDDADAVRPAPGAPLVAAAAGRAAQHRALGTPAVRSASAGRGRRANRGRFLPDASIAPGITPRTPSINSGSWPIYLVFREIEGV